MSQDILLLLKYNQGPQEYNPCSENLKYNAIITTYLYKTLRWEMDLLHPKIHMCMQMFIHACVYMDEWIIGRWMDIDDRETNTFFSFNSPMK